jgi:hypothetical protein
MLYEGGGETRTEARTKREIVEAAAARGVEVVRQHRVHLARLYRVSYALPNPETRATEPRTDRTDRTAYPQSCEPNPGHTRERGLKSRSEALKSG